jgi:hypothetical protein
MNLNTNTKKLTLTKTERGYLSKAKAILLELARIAPAGGLSDASDVAADQIGQVEQQLIEPAEAGVTV